MARYLTRATTFDQRRIHWLEHDTEVIRPGGHLPEEDCRICALIRIGWSADRAIAHFTPPPDPAKKSWR